MNIYIYRLQGLGLARKNKMHYIGIVYGVYSLLSYQAPASRLSKRHENQPAIQSKDQMEAGALPFKDPTKLHIIWLCSK